MKSIRVLALAVACFCLVASDGWSRGGRGGRGGRTGGGRLSAPRQSRSFGSPSHSSLQRLPNQTPAFSKAHGKSLSHAGMPGKTGLSGSQHAGAAAGLRPGTHGKLPGIGHGPSRSQLSGFLGTHPGNVLGHQGAVQALDHATASQIRDHWQNRTLENRPFATDWVSQHAAALDQVPAWHCWNNPAWAHPGQPYYWWRGATAVAITGWVACAWTQPTYYNYGDNVTYQDGDVYIDGQPYCSAQQYYDQATGIAAGADTLPASNATEVQWLPLGVFAVVPNDTASSDSLIQLAVSKEGALSGTFFHRLSGTTRPLKGSVDKKTQRAVWTFADDPNSDVLMEAGIFNLTEDQCTVLVHHGAKDTETYRLVRLSAPDTP